MMNTKVWKCNTEQHNEQPLQEAANILVDGGTVAFPTETVYGLGADATNEAAVKHIFAAKGRPSDNPLIVHVATMEQVQQLVMDIPPLAMELMHTFWPGPLTIILPVKKGVLAPTVTAGLDTVGVRIPQHPLALSLLSLSGIPIAAPSANLSGKPSPTKAEHVWHDLNHKVNGIVDGGETGVGLESTVVQVMCDQIHILRPGGITLEQLQNVCHSVIPTYNEKEGVSDTPRSPGMKYTHYAPQGQLTVVQVQGQSNPTAAHHWIEQQVQAANEQGRKTGVLTYDEDRWESQAHIMLSLGSKYELEQAAHTLYSALRMMDESNVEFIWAQDCDMEGIGTAIKNRLHKAADVVMTL
ncbi:L-threonylcarbamoyladenylate synthase [Longirhabdus pacifica]|uniref:L-threonylcarbamoyladenylate synthase n=1 Tax=Longirhabdus pacifica TaxID=2305227 RepID=UPI001F0C9F63|nr:L-threonylcarbamoyladenylate synthase [Longirhabdus pacifica]